MANMTIGNRLKQLLAETGKTQSAVAKAAGVGRGAISAIVTGRTKNPQPEHIFLIADELGVEPRWLATGKGRKNKKEIGLSADQRAWLQLYEMLPPGKRQAARRFLIRLVNTTWHPPTRTHPDHEGESG